MVNYSKESNTTHYMCKICKEWYFRDEVIVEDIDNNPIIRDELISTDNIICHSCYDNNY